MRCPECGGAGSMGCFIDELHGGYEVTHFFCDANPEHHFLIYKLEPYVINPDYLHKINYNSSNSSKIKEEL